MLRFLRGTDYLLPEHKIRRGGGGARGLADSGCEFLLGEKTNKDTALDLMPRFHQHTFAYTGR